MSKKSKNGNSIGNPSAIANAMYDAQKKEITSSMVLSLSFIAAGLIVAAIGIFQYFHIKGNMTDSSENIDAMAWIVIAGVGLLVGIIGLVSIMKSVVSLGQIGSWAKEAESHASPFQAQKLHRKVAAMNQAHSMEKPDNQGMAEGENAQKPKLGFFKRGKENKNKQNSDELYYKYNPQEKKQAVPEKAAPMMEQKFDYGINEAKKLTFADEFLKKNKRDPFEQYRKELGIKEEPEKEVKQKPKFIINSTANQDNSTAVKEKISAPQPQAQPIVSLQKQEEPGVLNPKSEESVGIELDFSPSFSNEEPQQSNTNILDFTNEQQNAPKEATPLQFEDVAIKSSPYGVHNEADDDIFFSSKSSSATAQQTQTVQQQFTPNLAAALDKAAPTAPVPPTVVLDLDYKKQRTSEEYDFSLYEEITPGNKKQQKTHVQQKTAKNSQTNTANDDMFYGGTSKQKVPEADTQQNFMSNFVNDIASQNNSTSLEPTPTTASPVQPEQPAQAQVQVPVQQHQPQQKVPFTQRKKNASKTTTPPKSRNTKSRKNKQNKKSFSEMFLNNNGKIENSDSEIVKNGTRAQRKFVDAAEYDEWTCPQCGKVNQEYVGVCACGSRKPRAKR